MRGSERIRHRADGCGLWDWKDNSVGRVAKLLEKSLLDVGEEIG